MVVVQRDRGARVHAELVVAEHGSARHEAAHDGIGSAAPAGTPEAQRRVGQLAHEALTIVVPAAHERQRRREAPRLFRREHHRVVQGRHTVHRQIVQVAQPDLLQAAHRIALLGEEDVVRLDAAERDHPQRIVGEEVDEQGVGARLHAPDEIGRDGTALDDEHDIGTPRRARALEQAQDPELVGGLRRLVLVERVVAPVLEEPHRVTARGELLAKIDAHEAGPIERKHDEPTHGP